MSSGSPPRVLEGLAALGARGLAGGESIVGDLAEGYRRKVRHSGPVLAGTWYAGEAASIVLFGALGAIKRLSGTPPRPGAGPRDLREGPFRSGMRDVSWAARSMARSRWLGLGVLTILTLAIAANTAAVSLVAGTYRAVSWWEDGARIVSLWPDEEMSMGQLQTVRDEATAFDIVGGWVLGTSSLLDDQGEATSASVVAISPELFGELTVTPVLGRGLVPEDGEVGAEPVVVLGHALWENRYGSDPSVVGRVVDMDGVRRRVVGIQGAGGRAPGPGAEGWIPLVLDQGNQDFWPQRNLRLVGRLSPGMTVADGREDFVRVMQVLAQRFSFFFPPDFGLDATATPANDELWAPMKSPLVLLLAGTLLLLAVAAVDLGNLFLGRTLERVPELRVRTALGASRRRLLGQLLVEGGLWTALGVLFGCGLGSVLADRLAVLFPLGAQVTAGSFFAGGVPTFVLATATLVWLLMSGVPMVSYLRATRGGVSPRRFEGGRAQATLVVTQAAFATVLLVGSGLFVRSVAKLREIPLGYDPHGVVAMRVTPSRTAYPAGEAQLLFEEIEDRVRAIPGVRAVGLAAGLPLADPFPTAPVNRRESPEEIGAALRAYQQVVDPGYFDALRARVVRGRALLGTDRRGAEPVVVVNETMARALWPGQDPIGRQIAVDPHAWDSWLTVVGVIQDMRFRDVTLAVPPAFYLPLAQNPARQVRMIVSGTGAPVAEAAREAVAAMDERVPVSPSQDMEKVVADAYGVVGVLMGILSALGVLSIVLGAVGLYGALASSVTRYRVELSTRLALGAHPRQLVARVLATGLALTLAGVAAGSLVAALGGNLLRALLFGISPWDPIAFLVSAAILGGTAAIAALVPAARAGMTAPADVLRNS